MPPTPSPAPLAGPPALPDWSNIFVWRPGTTLSTDDRANYVAWRRSHAGLLREAANLYALAKRLKDDPDRARYEDALTRATAMDVAALKTATDLPLTTAQRDALLTRKYQALAIQTSHIPEWRRNWTRVLTVVDDTQDALSVLSTLGITAARWIPRLGKPSGWIGAGAAALNVVNTVGRLPSPRSIKKLEVLALASKNPKLLLALIKGRPHALGLRNLLPFLAEAAQVSADWFGVGLQLGPIFGYIDETLFRAVDAADKIGAAVADLRHSPDAGKLMDAAVVLARTGTRQSPDERLTTAIAIAASQQAVRDTFSAAGRAVYNFGLTLWRALPIPPFRRSSEWTRLIIDTDEAGPTDLDQWPILGGIDTYELALHGPEIQREARAWVDESLDLAPSDAWRELFGTAINLFSEGWPDLALAQDRVTTPTPTARARALMILVDRGAVITPLPSDFAADAFLDDLALAIARGGQRPLPPRELDRIARAHRIAITFPS